MSRKCSCGKRAMYGIFNKKPTHCKTCKSDDMKDVMHKKCPCGKQPSYGLVNGKATHCKECKTNDMKNVRDKKCSCGNRMSFGLVEKKPTHCKECKTDDMRDVVSKKCPCGNRPSVGLVEKKPTHCKECKTDDMRNVINKKCPCGKRPKFGIFKGQPTHCKECKTDDMKDVVHTKCPCGTIASFGVEDGNPTHCAMCKTSVMFDIAHKRCPGYDGEPCKVGYRLLPGREYCPECDPDTSRSASKKRSEAAFFRFLKKSDVDVTQTLYNIDFRCIDTDKTRAEIDGVIITRNVVVCLELDEYAHETYDKNCELTRMHNATAELMLAFPDHSIAWVRVNPHIKINGKWDTSKDAKKVRDRRHKEALKVIKDILQHPRNCVEYVGY